MSDDNGKGCSLGQPVRHYPEVLVFDAVVSLDFGACFYVPGW